MTAPLMPRATAVWLVENTSLTFRQISFFCEIHELEIQAMADGDVGGNIRGISPIDNGQLSWAEIHRCEADKTANLQASELECNAKLRNLKAKKMLTPSQRQEKPNAVLWFVKNYPNIKDSLICKLVGTTKATINAIRDGVHKEMANLRAKDPVSLGLCTEVAIDEAIKASMPKPKAVKPKAVKAKKSAKTKKAATKKAANKKTTAKKTTAKKAAKKATAKSAVKKETALKKKAAAKKTPAKKTPAKKTATKKATTKTAVKKATAKKATAKKAAVKKPVAKKTATAKKTTVKKAAAKN